MQTWQSRLSLNVLVEEGMVVWGSKSDCRVVEMGVLVDLNGNKSWPSHEIWNAI